MFLITKLYLYESIFFFFTLVSQGNPTKRRAEPPKHLPLNVFLLCLQQHQLQRQSFLLLTYTARATSDFFAFFTGGKIKSSLENESAACFWFGFSIAAKPASFASLFSVTSDQCRRKLRTNFSSWSRLSVKEQAKNLPTSQTSKSQSIQLQILPLQQKHPTMFN